MKNTKFKKTILTGLLAAACTFPLHSQEKQKIDLQLDSCIEKKVELPAIFRPIEIGNFDFQFFMPRIFYSGYLSKADFFAEIGYIQKDSENGLEASSKIKFNPFELSLGGYLTLNEFGVAGYGFNFGLGVSLNSNARIRFSYHLDEKPEKKDTPLLSLNFGVNF